MRGALAAMLAPALLLAAAPAAPVPKERPRPLYFPTKIGTRWVYDQQGHTLTLVVTKVEAADGGTLVTIENEPAGGGRLPYEVILVSRGGLSRVSEGGEAYTPPWPLLKLPHRPGGDWGVDTVRGGGRTAVHDERTARGVEKVAVPAGTFEAIRVEYDWSVNGHRQSRQADWYAPGVGLVKREWPGNVWVLKSFTPGKD